MMPYVLTLENVVESQRGTMTQAQSNAGCIMGIARNPEKKDADPETGGWKEGAKIPDSHMVKASELKAIAQIPKAHLLNCIAFGR